jgi:hemerythrin-like domain-containing protein
MSKEAIARILEEHRSLKAIVHGLKHLVNEARSSGGQCDFKALRAMLYYIDAYPEKRHHPKEETFIFARLRERTDAADKVLDELETQHLRTEAQVKRLHSRLEAFENGETGGLAAFANAVDEFAETMWQHMTMEEKVLLPLARTHLTDADWARISEAFCENDDPAYVVACRDDLAPLLKQVTEFAATKDDGKPR